MKIYYTYYRFDNPGFPISDWDYPAVKEITKSGRKVDFYGYKGIFKAAKYWVMLHAISLSLIILLKIKIYFLPSDGASYVLHVVYNIYIIIALITLPPLYSLFIVLLKAFFYNKKLNKLLKNTDTYHEWERQYYKKRK